MEPQLFHLSTVIVELICISAVLGQNPTDIHEFSFQSSSLPLSLSGSNNNSDSIAGTATSFNHSTLAGVVTITSNNSGVTDGRNSVEGNTSGRNSVEGNTSAAVVSVNSDTTSSNVQSTVSTSMNATVALPALSTPSGSSTVGVTPNSEIVSTTANPSRCSGNATESCVKAFRSLYSTTRHNETQDITEAQIQCSGSLSYSDADEDDCYSDISAHNCTTLKASFNHSTFGLRCTPDGQLKQIAWTPESCTNDFQRATNMTTLSFCTMPLNHTLACNTLASSAVINSSASTVFTSITRTSLLTPLLVSKGCIPPATTPIPLLLNPVSPEAITAIVVCVCLGIICILAGFFFWPKCHLSEAAIAAAKKELKEAKNQKRIRSQGDGVRYNASQDAVAIGGAPHGANQPLGSSVA